MNKKDQKILQIMQHRSKQKIDQHFITKLKTQKNNIINLTHAF